MPDMYGNLTEAERRMIGMAGPTSIPSMSVPTSNDMQLMFGGQVGPNNTQIYGTGGQLNQQQAVDYLRNNSGNYATNGAMPVAQWQALNPQATPDQLASYKHLNQQYTAQTSGQGMLQRLGNAANFQLDNIGNVVKGVANNPTQLLTGGIDPLGTRIGNTLTGSNNQALVGQFGGPTNDAYSRYEQTHGFGSLGAARNIGTAADYIAGMSGAVGAANGIGNLFRGVGQAGEVYSGGGSGAGGGLGAGDVTGQAAAAADGALPEIVVTGTTGSGIGAGQLAGLGAGAAGIGAAAGNFGAQGQGGLGVFGNGGQAGLGATGSGAAGQLGASGGIGGGAGIGGTTGGALGSLSGAANSVSGVGGGSSMGTGTGWLDWLGNNAGTIAGLANGLIGGGKTKNQTTTSTNEPPAYLLPYLQQAAQGAAAQFGSGGPQYFPGATLAPQSQNTQDALSGIAARARSGSPLVSTAQNFVQNGLQQPITSNYGASQNPYATPVSTSNAANPYASAVGTDTSANPYASAVTAGTQAQNPYASAPNTFGGASNPYLDATFDQALQKAQSGVESQYQRAGRNIGASAPVMGDIATNLASQIYAPAYENERNRQLQYQTQLNDIGSGAFENQQGRQLQSGLASQNIGANSVENSRSRQLQSGLQGQSIGANTYDQQQAQQLQAGLAGQQIGAQGYENAQQRQLSDIQGQRSYMDSLLGYASPLAAQDYNDLAQLQGAGANQDLYNQQSIDDARARYDYGQNQPGQTLDDYIRRITGIAGTGSTQTTSTPLYSNKWSDALGQAMLFQQLQNGFRTGS